MKKLGLILLFISVSTTAWGMFPNERYEKCMNELSKETKPYVESVQKAIIAKLKSVNALNEVAPFLTIALADYIIPSVKQTIIKKNGRELIGNYLLNIKNRKHDYDLTPLVLIQYFKSFDTNDYSVWSQCTLL